MCCTPKIAYVKPILIEKSEDSQALNWLVLNVTNCLLGHEKSTNASPDRRSWWWIEETISQPAGVGWSTSKMEKHDGIH
jgi:hypothetical protein